MKLCELFEDFTRELIIETGGVGLVVPGVNTTPDVGPNEIKRQAKKFRNRVSKNGVPPVTSTNGKIPSSK